ncbi:hypothetical protein LNKW23_39990 [Paralimibaculum aggregatum]|uniref:DUF4189 domain-containing protein n=1 Tax=Paralimibaculum aggregatum TaxID=3036245 RepID=A0ABQ6LNN9_9RHOB|nr:DUF4189 domain-containing protein [Limibaculum sp. NKW23]GMG84783.1 hypothetical protein LNKW23_39990 [Limibaculum sp. NKW23]
MIRIALIAMLVGAALPAAAETFGAIAYSTSDQKWGRAWDYGSREAAETAAKEFCAAAGGANCETAVWLEDGCGAVARAPSTKDISQLGVSWGFETAEASRPRAIAECEQNHGGEACTVVASVCSWKKN